MTKGTPARDTLATRVVVIADADHERGAGIARAMVAIDAAVVLAGSDADALGALAAQLTNGGARVAVLVDDIATEPGRAAVVELVNELFPPRNT
jgi:NADP-dependent 3-hydroxy acid dehydrogenase YdfG